MLFRSVSQSRYPSSILWYLGKKGWGRKTTAGTVTARSNALKLLSYYDIYKNYYANVQQSDAYIIGASLGFTTGTTAGTTPTSFSNLNNMNLNVPASTANVALNFAHNIGRSLTNAEINSIQFYVQRYPDMTGNYGTTLSNLGTIVTNSPTQLVVKLNKLEGYATSNAIIIKVEQFPSQRTLQSFPLKNLDDIREKILYNNSTTAHIS